METHINTHRCTISTGAVVSLLGRRGHERDHVRRRALEREHDGVERQCRERWVELVRELEVVRTDAECVQDQVTLVVRDLRWFVLMCQGDATGDGYGTFLAGYLWPTAFFWSTCAADILRVFLGEIWSRRSCARHLFFFSS